MIGIYCRISTRGQEDKYSISTQIDLGQKFADTIGESYRMYVETGSGKDIQGRPEFDRLLHDIENKEIHKVWVVESSRLTRNMSDAIKVQQVFTEYNTTLYIDGNKVSLASAESILQYNVISAVSEYERTKIIERSIRGKTEWQNQGKMAMPTIYGYDYSYKPNGKKEWYINKSEAKVIQLIFKMFLSGMSYHAISIELNGKGYTTKKGGRWYSGQVKKALSQSLYIGKSWTTKGDLIESKIYPSIIDDEIWEKTQTRLAKIAGKRPTMNWKLAQHELTSLMHCAYCGAQYYYGYRTLKSGEKRLYYYHSVSNVKYKDCSQSYKQIYKYPIERLIRKVVYDEVVESDEKVNHWLNEFKERQGQSRQEAKSIIDKNKEKLEAANKKRKRIVDLVAEGVMTKEDVKENLGELNKEMKIAEQEIKQAQLILQSHSEDEEAKIYKAVFALSEYYDDLDAMQKRELYKLIFEDIIIDGNKILCIFANGKEERLLFKNTIE